MAGGYPWTEAEDRAVLASPTVEAYNLWARSNNYPARNDEAFLKRRTKVRKQAVRHLLGTDPTVFPDYTAPQVTLPVEHRPDYRPTATPSPEERVIYSDKKVGSGDWRERFEAVKRLQELKAKGSWSQHDATIMIPTDRPIGLIGISDTHIGAWSTDYHLIERLTDEILSIPNLYVVLLGDLAHLAVKLRSVEEVSDNVLPPDMQIETVLLWLEAIQDRILLGCWGNHESRLESQSGSNHLYEMIKRKVVWSNGMAKAEVCVGNVIYKMAFSHHFSGRSIYNHVHGPQRFITMQSPETELAWCGDSHQPAFMHWFAGDNPVPRIAVNAGSTQTMSGYAKRYFSLRTHPKYPMVELDHEEHRITPFASVKDWLRVKQQW